MGKRRHRRYEGNWWTESTGGAPHWVAVLTLVVIAAILGGSFAVASNRPEAAPASTPLPSQTYSFETPQPERTRVVFFGDSYSAGTGASSATQRWTTLTSKALGWTENNAAYGGTGYVVDAGQEGCGQDSCPTYTDAIAASKVVEPKFVILSGGRNDGDQGNDYRDRVLAVMDAAKAKWPAAQLVVTSPVWDDDNEPRWFQNETIPAVQSAAEQAGARWVDLGEPLFDRSDLVVEDGVHPNDAGHRAISDAFLGNWNAS